MSSGELRVIIDIDDVQLPWAQVVHEACIDQGIALPDSTWTQWEMWLDYPSAEKSDWLRVVDSLVVPNGVYHGEPYPGTVDAVRRLTDAGHKVYFVTARGFFAHSQEIRNWTREWVAKWYADIPVDLTFAQDKGRIAKQVKATHAIDDSMKNVIDLVNAGVDAYLMNQPHNRAAFVHPSKRVDSVAEFVERIING